MSSVNTGVGFDQATVWTMSSVNTGVGVVHSVLVPILLTRIRHLYDVIAFATVCLLVGYRGPAYAPAYD